MSRVDAVKSALRAAFAAADMRETPYRHWFLDGLLPDDIVSELQAVPLPAQEVDVSGTREANNSTRQYFDTPNQARFPAFADVAGAFQAPDMIATLNDMFGASLDGNYLRIEYAQDTDGFWLHPHTDIGVKVFTMLLYLSGAPGHDDLGTDIYLDRDTHAARTAFRPNHAMVFIPSDRTWHGFEPRPIPGVRQSIIINYVTPEWRARDQLAFPESLVKAA
ncbi:2OG-Fe(II) oxygenase [Alkalicaulis satelles]|uniref:2OG-Fe(II) oxygenase n=1 Tax=Alkalicaulis satelles TaxID=2609175 RepID=A0A5M6ZG93_9PROT|nr:2OG-Fe(II) oxygenase [Alkalicaulis satelles]KAA5803766.1 2OG-Fe(II) oxygenase [Alkalicaulis satelles]